MKKVLAFLILFSLALLALRFFEGDSGDPQIDPVPDDPIEQGDPDRGTPKVPDDPNPGAGPGQKRFQGLAINGPFEGRLFDGDASQAIRSLVLFVTGKDSRTDALAIGGAQDKPSLRDVLLDATADLFRVGAPDAPQAKLTAREITFARSPSEDDTESALGIETNWERRAEFAELGARLLTDAPFVPLNFEAASATLDARDSRARTLFAPGLILIDSQDLSAEGEDLTIALDQNSFSFARASTVVFKRALGEQVTLRSSGSLVVSQLSVIDPEAGDLVQIEARDGAQLDLELEDTSTLKARVIRVRGREGPDGFQLQRLEAEGDVVWISGQSEARGERARLDFDAAGQLAHWSLEQDPSLRLLLEQLQGLETSDLPSHGFVRITGAGPLTGQSGDVRGFKMAGPALIEVTDTDADALASTTLRSGGQVSGRIDQAGSTLNATGGVLMDAPEGQLEAQALEVTLTRDEDDLDVVAITTIGGAKLTSTSKDERILTLVSGGRLRATRRGDLWHVDEAQQVTLSVEPADLEAHPEKADQVFRAQAGLVTSFDPSNGDLVAEGGVQVIGDQGVGRGESIVISKGERIELVGTPDQPASFEGPEGSASAQHIVREKGHMEAEGKVVTRFVRTGSPSFPTQDYEIRCDRLVADQGREVLPDGGELHTFDLDATGSVDGRVGFGEESSTIRCDRLIGKRRERWARDPSGDLVPQSVVTVLNASGNTKSNLALRDSQVELTCATLDLTRSGVLGMPSADEQEQKDPFTILAEARGSVVFDLFTVSGGSPIHLVGSGDSLSIDETLTGALSPLPGGRVHLEGSLPGQTTPYALDADSVGFKGGETLDALNPVITVGDENAERNSLSRFVASASRLSANDTSLVFDEQVQLETWTAAGVPWRLNTQNIVIKGGVGAEGGGLQLKNLRADGGVEIALGLRGGSSAQDVVASAKAQRITGSTVAGTIRLEGFPDGTPAEVITPAMVIHADWIEVDPEIQLIRRSGPGTMSPATQSVPGVADWDLRYSAARSFEDREADSFLFAIDQPYFESRYMQGLLRGTVALFWFDKVGWQDLPERVKDSGAPNAELRKETLPDGASPSGVPIARFLDLLKSRNLDGVLKEVYFEGPIEILRGDDLVAHAENIYVDCLGGKAWLTRPQFNLYGDEVGEQFEKLVVRAEWIRQTSEGVLQADAATITTSPFAKPSLVIETGDLRIVPSRDSEDQNYQVYMRENRIRFSEGGFSLPLPPIAFGTDDEYKPLWPTARFGNSARFGTLVSLGFRRPLPKALGATLNDALGGGEGEPYDASFSVDASWLSGRGGLLDIGLDIEAQDKYEVETLLGVVPDGDSDQGYIRVPEDDRDNPRLWFRAHSRFELDRGEWLDIEASVQSDAGVQSEFWENEFERYERDESYVQWRKAKGETYYQATAKKRLEVFRSTVEELPSLGAAFGRRPIFSLGGTNLIWDADIDASYLRRRAGEAGFQSPFDDTPLLDGFNDEFADGFGDRELLRFDTRQRLELPVDLGDTGLRATPFVDGRFTAWDEGQNPEASPTRFMATAGLRLATQLWRRNSNGSIHQLVPFFEYANEIAENAVGNPVTFDAVDLPIGGDRLDLGLRGRFGVQDGTSLFDVELRARNQRNTPSGVDPGWQPLGVFARMDFEPLGTPVQIWHDARYDLSDGSTRYALTALGYRVNRAFGYEIGHRIGRNINDDRLFEAAVVSGQYRWTEKWEFEGNQVFSLLAGNGLDTKFVLRRYGADLVFELTFKVREGEGSSVSISFRPRFGFNPSRIGVIGY